MAVAEVAELTHRAGEGVVVVVLDDAGPILGPAVTRRVNEGYSDEAISVVLEAQVNK